MIVAWFLELVLLQPWILSCLHTFVVFVRNHPLVTLAPALWMILLCLSIWPKPSAPGPPNLPRRDRRFHARQKRYRRVFPSIRNFGLHRRYPRALRSLCQNLLENASYGES